jgi:hypothetical protein
MRPLDHCPYGKPFPAEFAECPAYQPVRFIPVSSNDDALTPTHTCRHLVAKRHATEVGRWYPACSLGDEASRRAWVEAIDPERLAVIGRLRLEMAELNARYIDQLWLLKRRQLNARPTGQDAAAITRQMQEVGEQFLAQTRQYLDRRPDALQAIEVTVDALIELLRASIDRLISRSSGEVRWEIPEEVLGRFSPPVRLFFRPPSPERMPSATSGA